eukprot:1192104-Prorocentrum_minimum.AAC.4
MSRSLVAQVMRLVFAVLCLVAVADAVTVRPKGGAKHSNNDPERRELMEEDVPVLNLASFSDPEILTSTAGCDGPECEVSMMGEADHMEEMAEEPRRTVLLPGCGKTVSFSEKLFHMMRKAPALPRDSVVCPN